MKNILLFILLFTSSFNYVNGQEYEINLKSGRFTPEVTTDFGAILKPQLKEINQEYIYRLIQFYTIPTNSQKQQLNRIGIDLISYIPNKTYISKLKKNISISSIHEANIRSILNIETKFKTSPMIAKGDFPDWALIGDNILLNVKYNSEKDRQRLVDFIINETGEIIGHLDQTNTVTLQFPTDKINELANNPLVQWIDIVSPPGTPDNTVGKGSTRSNTLNTSYPGGRKYDGSGVVVGLSDDGVIGPHIDFSNRVILHTEENDGIHGDMTSGIFTGAGNLDPTVGGMAPGSIMHIFKQGLFIFINSYEHIINGVTNKEELGIAITSTSYGQGVGGVYDSSTEFTDQQINQNPNLIHILSAGNSGTFDHNYGAGPGWANISGGIKAGKNVICAGNVDENDELFFTSSRGPAADGRIKPDLCAQGQNHISTNENNTYQVGAGTSASTPAIAGVVAQLYQAYKESNDGIEPETGLIKAALMNTAEDLGNPGPDYKHGWGRINGLKAVRVIEEKRYLSENIAQGGSNNHNITVPANVSEVRIMTYWMDVEGNPASAKGLVNDINMQVVTPDGTMHNPWVLDPTPTAASLDADAVEGIDNLNNVEQVTLDNPEAGDYTINIDGFAIPEGPQKYYVLYDFIFEGVELTYPIGGESFVPGTSEQLRWDASKSSENFVLEYSIDSGINWTFIANAASDARTFVWSVPSAAIGSALVRITNGEHTDTSNDNFSIAEQVEGFAFSVICPDEVTFTWDLVEGAESYDVYMLGNKYMEIIGNSTTSSLTIPIDEPTTIWAAIVAKNDTEQWSSLRTTAISHTGFLNCTLPNDIAIEAINNDNSDFVPFCSETPIVIVSALISNPGINPQSNFMLTYQINNQDLVSEMYTGTILPGEQVTYDFSTQFTIPESGSYSLTISVDLDADQNSFNDVQTLDFFTALEAQGLDYEEDFESSNFVPSSWMITNNDNMVTWTVRSGIVGPDGNTSTIFIDNYVYETTGEEDIFTTDYFDLSSLSSAVLTFDLAKAQLSPQYSDGLRVEISTDCGESFSTIYDKAGLELSTLPDYFDDRWRLTDMKPEDWRTEQIDLSDYTGEFVQLRFVNINNWGNPTHIDNINLRQELVSTEESILSGIELFPNPASETIHITTNSQFSTDAFIVITNSLGQVILKQNMNGSLTESLDISNYQTGLYLITISSKGRLETRTLIIE